MISAHSDNLTRFLRRLSMGIQRSRKWRKL